MKVGQLFHTFGHSSYICDTYDQLYIEHPGNHFYFSYYFQSDLDQNLNSKKIIMEPSPMKAVVKKVIGSLLCAFVFMKFSTVYPIKSLKGKFRVDLCTKVQFIRNAFTLCQTTTSRPIQHFCTNSGSL